MEKKEIKKKTPHQMMSEENNGLSSMQEVSYQDAFNKADGRWKETGQRKK
ncbi:YfhE family protein [Bacillus sp. B190/17]|uniref:YfhE family protein n=1 Tax=Bacillus lumedeiriae TaxID=3058829 RepID=A0ABW8I831_9BACI